METNRFKVLLQSENVTKVNESNSLHLISENGKLIILFVFEHSGLPARSSNDPDRRIILEVFLTDNLNPQLTKTKLRQVSNKSIVLVNSNNEDFAFTYTLLVDEERNNVELKILDLPRLGEMLITEEEKEGITAIVK